MNKEIIKDIIKEKNNLVSFLPEIYDDALIGTGTKDNKVIVAAYDIDVIIELIIENQEKSEIEALEYIENILKNSYAGKNEPVFICDFREIKEIEDIMKDINEHNKNVQKS